MSNIAWIEKQIATVSEFIDTDELRLREKPTDFGLRLVAKNNRQYLESLRHDLMLAQAERDKEVMELRLIAPGLERGAIPLRLLARLSDPLHKFLAGAAYYLRHGKDSISGIPSLWSNLLDLRLANVGRGSTRLYLTGNVTPDLAGDSALQDGLGAIFRLLNADSEEFFDALHSLGPVAAKGLTDFLAEMVREGAAAEFSWTSPDNCLHRWEGRFDEIVRLHDTLDVASSKKVITTENLSGSVTLLSTSGRLEILPDGGATKIKISYPKGDQGWLAGVTLHQRVSVVVEKTTWPDPVTGGIQSRYALIEPVSHDYTQRVSADTRE